MRYCKQRDTYSCGAIALLNVDKFFGRCVTYRDLPKYLAMVRCNTIDGTRMTYISKAIGRASRRTWKSSKQFLREGNCIILLIKEGGEGHYFVMGMYETEIFIVNRFLPSTGTAAAYVIPPSWAAMFLRTSKRTWYVDKATGLL